MNHQKILRDLRPAKEFFTGIDSDGCVFDTMEVKQKEFFIPAGIKYFDLFAIAKVVRETWEFVNLNSIYRGGNRFTALIKVFELLSERKEVRDSSIELPDVSSLKEWIRIETKLGNASLRKYFETNYNPDLEKVVRWTEAINRDITDWLHAIPPFPHARETIEKISRFSDIMVVSQTPLEALEREWEEHDLKKYVRIIAGLGLSAKHKYSDNKILMIGDAKGDLDAAKNNGLLFYPIVPGKEDESWEKLLNEGLERFTSGRFAGEFEEKLLIEFNRSLPDTPPWKNRL
jgi:phosphoglycolate phosphatase-like HAD superfamily hydrolase